MRRIVFLLFVLVLFIASVRVTYSHELRRAVADSTDDAQQAVNGGSVFASAPYMELMLNWFQKRWGGAVRFPSIAIPQGAEINSAYISIVSYSTCWLRTYDSVACEAVDSASSFSTASGSYDISNRWSNRTDAFLVWNEDMRNASIFPDSSPDLKDLLQEVVNRPNWKSGNSVVFIFKNVTDTNDSAMYEFRTWEDVGYEESLFVNYTTGGTVPDPPIVSDIRDSTIAEGESFDPIDLDDYVADPDDHDSVMIWTHWGEVELLVDVTDRMVTITVPDSEWNASETIWFKACDPGGLCDSNEASFTVTPVKDPPIVSNIRDSTIAQGESYAPINLDDEVIDPDDHDSVMIWTHWGEVELLVDVTDRVVTITVPDPGWNGFETIWFKACDPGGLCDSNEATFTLLGSDFADEDSLLLRSADFLLNQNHPNPFNPATCIEFDLSLGCQVKLEIYNILGNRVRTLIDDRLVAGHKSITWDGKDNQGKQVTSGIYFYRLKAGDFTESKKMVIVR